MFAQRRGDAEIPRESPADSGLTGIIVPDESTIQRAAPETRGKVERQCFTRPRGSSASLRLCANLFTVKPVREGGPSRPSHET
jgi:hypothetical protein